MSQQALQVSVVARMRELRKKRVAPKRIAEVLGVSLACVRKYGPRPVPTRRAIVAELLPRIVELRLAGLSARKVARRLGVEATTVYVHTPGIDLRQLAPCSVPLMLAMEQRGFSRTAIAAALGVHINTVVKHLLRNGCARKRQ